MLRVALVGYGLAGRVFHAPVISATEGLQLTTIVRRSGELVDKFPEVLVFTELQDAFALADVVVIATPNTTHFPLAMQCLQAGKHVVVDKPMATSVAEALELAREAQSRRLVLAAFHNRRWDGDFLTLQEILSTQEVGRAVALYSRFDRFRSQLKQGAWREDDVPGSGVLFDLAPHLLDQALVLFGTPEALYADVRRERDGARVDDAFDVDLLYPKLRVHLGAGMLVAQPGPRFLLEGTRGSFVKHGLDPQEDALKRAMRPDDANWAALFDTQPGFVVAIDGEQSARRQVQCRVGNYRGFYENVRDAIVAGAELAVTPQDAVNVIYGIELAKRSSEERRALEWGPPTI